MVGGDLRQHEEKATNLNKVEKRAIVLTQETYGEYRLKGSGFDSHNEQGFFLLCLSFKNYLIVFLQR